MAVTCFLLSLLFVLLQHRHDDIGGGMGMFVEAKLDYPDNPSMIWTKNLPKTGSSNLPGVGRGNAVQVSPDDQLVYVTLSEGTLHTLQPFTGDITSTHNVEPWGEDWSVECRSGIVFHLSDSIKYAVYAVVDIPPTESDERVQSRVIAIVHPTGNVLFTSSPFPGRIAGTPVITSDGLFILLTRNTEDDTVGHFTILSVLEKGKVKYTEASNQFRKDDEAPYGPPGIVHKPERGMFESGTGNRNDVVLWADSTDFGRADDGLTRGFQFPIGFNAIDFGDVQTVRLRIVGFTSTNKPVFTRDGLNVYFTGTRSAVRGWNEQDFGGPITWKADLTRKKNDGLQPIFSAIGIERDEERLFVGSAGSTFVALNNTGGILWEKLTDSVVLIAPHVSPDDRRVYFIETAGGTVKSYDAKRGTEKWSANCGAYLNSNYNCFNANVEGEFSMSGNGYRIYLGNTFGTIAAMSVSYEPTASPTVAPTTASPTVSPSHVPTSLAPTSLAPTPAPTTERIITPSPTVTMQPTAAPSPAPTSRPTKQPTVEPTFNPIPPPTEKPTASPTIVTIAPTEQSAPPTQSSGPSSRDAMWVLSTTMGIFVTLFTFI